jgi:acyl-CoA reductase-like NAD-dependent aldehyde dehydrogenase
MHRFGSAGQRCTAPKRLFIHHRHVNEFKKLLVDATSKLTVGDPTLESTDVGPVINTTAADTVYQRVQQAVDRGAKVLIGHKRGGAMNNLLWPTVIEGIHCCHIAVQSSNNISISCIDVPDDCELVADETFGPVLPIRSFTK